MNLSLEIRHLNLIVAISEEGTISKAADRLFLTQSALSHQLRDIEQKLGTELFLRLKKRMVLTPPGEMLLQSAKKMLSELKAVEENVRDFAQPAGGGILRISTECYTCYHWLPSIFNTFSQRHPKVKVQIEAEATRKPIQALLDGKIDLAIVSSEIKDLKLLAISLFEDECVALVSPAHRFAARSFLIAEDFSDEHLYTYSFPAMEIAIFQKLLSPNGVVPKQVSQVMLTEAIIEMVKANLGISVLARWAASPQIESGALRAIPITEKGITRNWSAVVRKTPNPPEYLFDFADLLKEEIVKTFR